MIYYSTSLEGKDCLSWCYIFVPLFEDCRFLTGVFLVTLIACVTCRGLICFTISMTCLVFWTLTCLQCPLPCHHYRGIFLSTISEQKGPRLLRQGSKEGC